MHRIRLFWTWVLASAAATSGAQLPDYHVRLFDERYGIRKDVQIATMDQDNFIWLATSNQIFRFDGKRTIEFPFRETINSVYCDRQNTVWATSSRIIYQFRNDHQGFVPVPFDTTEHVTFGHLTQIPGNPLWLQTSGGFFEWQPQTQAFKKLDNAALGIPEVINSSVFSRFENTLFISTRDSFFAIDVHHRTRVGLPKVNEQGGIYGISHDQMLVTGRGNITSWCDFKTREITRLGSDFGVGKKKTEFFFIEDALPIDHRRVLVTTHDGVFLLDKFTRQFRKLILYNEGKLLEPTPYYFEIFLDPHHYVWIAHGNGLMRFSPFQETIGLIRNREYGNNTIWPNNARNFAEDEKGNLWISTSHGFGYWDLSQNTIALHKGVPGAKDWLDQASLRGLLYDQGNLIMGTTAGGTRIYDVAANRFFRPGYAGDYHLKQKHESDFIKQIEKLPGGDILIVANNLYRLDANDLILEEIEMDSITRQRPNAYHLDPNKNIWIGLEHGLMKYDSMMHIVDYWPLPHIVTAIHEYGDNRWLLGTTYGLYSAIINEDSVILAPVEYIKPNSRVAFIYQETSGRIWVGSNDGLTEYDPATGKSEVFDYFDNIQFTGMYSEPFVNREGMLFIAGQSGINYFNPSRMKPEKDSLQVSIMKVAIHDDDSSFFERAKLMHLRPGQNSIEITFLAPYYGNTDKIKYRYRLAGIHSSWQHAGNNNSIRFSSLPPGDYHFTVSASTNGHDWFESADTLDFNIALPFYQRWWFVTGLVLLAVGSIYGYLKNRIRNIRKKETIKRDYEKRIAEVEMHALRAQMNPHFMFNSLNSINNFILKNDPDNASGYLTKFSRLMRLILDNSRSEWVLLENELRALELYVELEIVRFDNAFEYQIEVAPEIDLGTTYVPPMIIQPYVENAIWHGLLHRKMPGGKLVIRLWREQERLHIRIEDNGVGREEARRLKSKSATKHKSHGMKITAERIEIVNRIYNVNARVQVEDIPGLNGSVGGTSVSLTLDDKNHDSHHSG